MYDSMMKRTAVEWAQGSIRKSVYVKYFINRYKYLRVNHQQRRLNEKRPR